MTRKGLQWTVNSPLSYGSLIIDGYCLSYWPDSDGLDFAHAPASMITKGCEVLSVVY